MKAGHDGLGKHLCELGLDDDVISFIKRISANADGDFSTYLKHSGNDIDPIMNGELHDFLSKFAKFIVDLLLCFGFYVLANMFALLSYIYSMHRLFGHSRKDLRISLHVLGAVTVFNALATFLLGLAGTSPIYASWEIATARIYSIDPKIFYSLTAATSLATFSAPIPVPLYFLWKSGMRVEQRRILAGLFGSLIL